MAWVQNSKLPSIKFFYYVKKLVKLAILNSKYPSICLVVFVGRLIFLSSINAAILKFGQRLKV